MRIKESCSRKVKIKKKWKVNRKLTAAKKRITHELRKKLNSQQVKELKERKDFLSKCIEEEEQIKERTRINKMVEEVKKGRGGKTGRERNTGQRTREGESDAIQTVGRM